MYRNQTDWSEVPIGYQQNLGRRDDQTQDPKRPRSSFTYVLAHYNILDYEEKIPSWTNKIATLGHVYPNRVEKNGEKW